MGTQIIMFGDKKKLKTIIFITIKVSKKISKYFISYLNEEEIDNSDQEHKEKLKKKHMKDKKIFLKNKKTKDEERPNTEIKILLEKKKK